MARLPQLYPWAEQLASRLPGLNPALASVLALWSLGMALSRCCGLDTVTVQLARLLEQPFDTVRQRLREFYPEAPAKRGRGRTDFQPGTCFAPLLAWVLSFWSQPRLALALDVTNLGDRFHVLCVSVLYGGVGIPVAWKVLPGNRPDAWHPYWVELLSRLKEAVPEGWQVVVLSDRGLESPRLFGLIVGLGWHPLMRAKGGGKFRPAGWHGWYAMATLLRRPGARRALAGQAYRGGPLACTLLACWGEGHAEPWLLLSDLPPAAGAPCWYAWRAWIEQGFKVLKRGGLDWQRTRMSDPGRVERLLLAIAVTALWLVAVGAEVEHDEQVETLGRLPAGRPRRTRLFALGVAEVLAVLLRGGELPPGRLFSEHWPEPEHPSTLSEEDFLNNVDLQL